MASNMADSSEGSDIEDTELDNLDELDNLEENILPSDRVVREQWIQAMFGEEVVWFSPY